MTNSAIVLYFGKHIQVACDRNCGKAWGINNRPRVHLSDDPDDWAYLTDDELGEAPVDPGTYEGQHGKPLSPDDFPNKWCVRECERSEKGRPDDGIGLFDFSIRLYNMPWLHKEQS